MGLSIVPRLGTVLGGTPVRLTGPCLEEDDNIICRFNDITVEGIYINEDLALCVSPEVQIIGQIMLHLTVVRSRSTATNYSGAAIFHYGSNNIIIICTLISNMVFTSKCSGTGLIC